MQFDAREFNRTKFAPRIERVKVPELQRFYGSGEPVWEVRGLTGEEMSRVRTAGDAQRNILAVVDGLASANLKEQAAAIRELIGASDTLPEDYVRRIEILLLGSVEPVERPVAVKLATVYPVTLHTLTDAILKLTGLGQEPGKSHGSGATQESATL